MPTQTPSDPASRLGAEAYIRRRETEDFRDAEFRRIVSTKCTWLKIHLVRPVERLLLKTLLLWGKGRRELLNPVVRHNQVVLGGRLPAQFDGYRILHLTDIHIDIDDAVAGAVARAVAQTEFDICVMTGDYRSLTIGPVGETLRLMGRLRGAIPGEVLCVLGNHDPIELAPGLERAGYRVLLNEPFTVARGGAQIAFCGIDDPVIFKTHDIGRATAGIPAGTVRILLSHSARTMREAEAAGIDLLLAGHTHGGQICMPGGWQPLKNERLPRKFCRGAWRFGGMQGYTSAGCGASGLPCRLNCPSEIVLHTLLRHS